MIRKRAVLDTTTPPGQIRPFQGGRDTLQDNIKEFTEFQKTAKEDEYWLPAECLTANCKRGVCGECVKGDDK